jgi:THAP domain
MSLINNLMVTISYFWIVLQQLGWVDFERGTHGTYKDVTFLKQTSIDYLVTMCAICLAGKLLTSDLWNIHYSVKKCDYQHGIWCNIISLEVDKFQMKLTANLLMTCVLTYSILWQFRSMCCNYCYRCTLKMPHCSAVNCANGARNGLKVHKFPRDPIRRAIRIQNCRRDHWIPTEHSVLCDVSMPACILLFFFLYGMLVKLWTTVWRWSTQSNLFPGDLQEFVRRVRPNQPNPM